MRPYLLFALVTLVLFNSCMPSLVAITDKEKYEKKWSNDDLKKIQFYLSDDIVLQRKLEESSTEIVSGKVKIVNGEKVEEVLIRRGTPGVLVFNPVDNRMGISFEKGDETYLMFVPNPDKDGRYYLAAADWKNKVGKINYDGKVWYTTPESGNAHLMIDMKKLNQVQRDQRVATGRKVEQ
ncbi:MAG: hypothetical protein SFW35_02595 [Chitinophagales bacterium]|nr:hypothetical protein [Chitinophagales bacterium]